MGTGSPHWSPSYLSKGFVFAPNDFRLAKAWAEGPQPSQNSKLEPRLEPDQSGLATTPAKQSPGIFHALTSPLGELSAAPAPPIESGTVSDLAYRILLDLGATIV